MNNIIKEELDATARLHLEMMSQVDLIGDMADVIKKCYAEGKKVLLFGNGGSAADAQHVAAELIGRFKKDRQALPAIAFTTDTSILTAIGNDFGFEHVFARQCDALVSKGDVVMAFSTSGNSANVINAVKRARDKGGVILGFTGRTGGLLKDHCDHILMVPSSDTAKIQEVHRTVAHIICKLVEL